MKKNIVCFLIGLMCISSCKDYLDTFPENQYDGNSFWYNPDLIEAFVKDIYTGVPYPFQWYMSSSLSDESVPYQNDGVIFRVTESTMSPDNKGAFENNWALCMENWYWERLYTHIRACNKFLENSDKAQFSEGVREGLIGEVYFLRAYFYSLLMMQYGGVIIVDGSVEFGDSYLIPRSSLKETVDFILNDCENAIKDHRLDGQKDKTRATVGAVLALKSRVLTYASGELFNNPSWASSYEHPELISYTDGKRRERLLAAKSVAEEIMGMNYSLYDVNPDKSQNFYELFLQEHSSEQIFITKYDTKNWPFYGTNFLAWTSGLKSFGGFSLNPITANLADAFENADGTPFNWAAQQNDPYSNRDPRFDASILHDGSNWTRPNTDYWYWEDYKVNFRSGVDAESPTGYAYKKFISPTENDWAYYWGTFQPYPYMQIRYAEILLNYAEVCIGLGEDTEARSALNMIRKRAGMPDISASVSGNELMKRYQNERRVELALEGHRFFDVRRWMIAPDVYKPVSGVKWNGSKFEELVVEKRAWQDSHYLIPISRSETHRNTALVQNPLYK